MSNDMIRIYEMNNGEKAFSPFSAAEMDSRQAKLRKLMADRQIDAAPGRRLHLADEDDVVVHDGVVGEARRGRRHGDGFLALPTRGRGRPDPDVLGAPVAGH